MLAQVLIKFKQGAFAPMMPVQPVIIRYSYAYVNPANVGDLWADARLFYMMVQPFTNVSVTMMPGVLALRYLPMRDLSVPEVV